MNKITLTALFLTVVFSSSRSYSQITPPYFDDFEGVNAGWTVDSVSGSTWELGTPSVAPTNSTHSGVNAWDVDLLNPYLPGTECYLISPLFDFSSAISQTLSFWQNRETEVGWDGARVDYSLNGGVSWAILGSTIVDPNGINWHNNVIASSGLIAWDGSSNGWIKSSYNLSILNGWPAVKFRIAFNSDLATQLAGFTIDDFEIAGPPPPPPLDAGVVAILDPNAGTPANTSTNVKVVVHNFGSATLATFPVTFSVNGIIAGTTIWNGSLAFGEIDTVTVGTFIVPSGIYNVCAYTELPADGDSINDTTCVLLNGISTGISVSIFDSLGFVNCVNPPVTDQFNVFGNTPTMNNGDTINLHVAFGDGTDTTLITQVLTGFFSAFVEHSYLFSGQFSTQVIAVDNTGGVGDTSVNYNQLIISDTCGNITGSVYADLNSNCIFDTTDFALSGIPVHLYQGGNPVRTYYSNPDGSYVFIVASATAYDLQIDTGYTGVISYCPASGAINGVTEPSTANDFGLVAGGGFDLEPHLFPFQLRINNYSMLWLNINNNFFIPAGGALKLVIDTNLLQVFNITPIPDAINGDTITWNAANLGSNSSSFTASLQVMPGASLAINDTVCLTVVADPIAGDSVSGNNIKTVCAIVLNSYDPNNKMVDPSADFTDPDGLFTYTINFQNTGNAPAFNLFLLDTIDSNLDISTLHVIQSSHLSTTTVVDPSVIKFSFNNIFLPDSGSDEPGSHGFISYSIAPKPGLTNGTQINNTAYIYFDFNPAIITNTTTNTINFPVGINEPISNSTVIVYPNPANEVIHVISGNTGGDLMVYDVYGKLVLSERMNNYHQELQVKNWKAGVYFITLKTKDSQITGRIMVVR